jgi:hypothetical protein
MNQWDPSFGRRIICKKPTEERDPAATEKRMGTRSTCHRRLRSDYQQSACTPARGTPIHAAIQNAASDALCRINRHRSGSYVSVNTSWIGTGKRRLQLEPSVDRWTDQEGFEQVLKRCEQAPAITDVPIPEVALSSFDQLLSLGGVQ